MPRATYPIPTMMAALSTIGCLDPISARWEASTFDNILMPFSFEYTNQEGQACTTSISVAMEIYSDLSATLLYTDAVSCDGGPTENNEYVSSVGRANTVEKRSEYIISFEAGQFSIDCLLKDKVTLDCVDLDGSSYSFKAK